MGADLNNIVKCQKLTDDHVQFLIYQILRGLKVSVPVPPEWGQLTVRGGSSWWVLHPQRFRSVHRGASVTSLKYCRITFYCCSFTSASLELCISKVTWNFYLFLWAESAKWWTLMPSGLLWLWIFHFFSFVYLCCSTGVAALLGVPEERETGTPTWWNPQTHCCWFLLQTDWSIWIVWAGLG